jgi:hypothetical protein
MRTRALGFLAAALLTNVSAQTVLFDFDNLAAHSPFPISVTQSGITAGRTFTILAADDLATAIGYWNVLGPAAEIAPGEYQFIDATAALATIRFYRVCAD